MCTVTTIAQLTHARHRVAAAGRAGYGAAPALYNQFIAPPRSDARCDIFSHGISKTAVVLLPTPVDRPLGENLYMLQGAGGNMAVLLDKQQSLLIDAQFDYMAPAIKASLQQLQNGAQVGSSVISRPVIGWQLFTPISDSSVGAKSI